jgi:hypothetical protein
MSERPQKFVTLALAVAAAALSVAAHSYPVDREVLDGSAVVLGRVGVAQLALAYGFKGEAQANIKFALDTTDQLKTRATKFGISDPVLFGRLAYKVGGGAGECFLPLLHGAFSTPLLPEKLLKSRAAVAELTDAVIVPAQVFIDVTEMRKDLQQASDALKSGRPDQASAALGDITTNALTSGEQEAPTVRTALDNLTLAQQLLHNHDFKAAGFAADHAREALTAAATQGDSALTGKAVEMTKAGKALTDLAEAIRSGKLAGQKAPENAAAEPLRQLEALVPKEPPPAQ